MKMLQNLLERMEKKMRKWLSRWGIKPSAFVKEESRRWMESTLLMHNLEIWKELAYTISIRYMIIDIF